MSERAAEGILTVLFTDVEGSTELLTRTGDADALRRLSDLHDAIAEEVHQHDGRIVKSLGDGVLASFGSPRRAVTCAVAIQRALKGLNRSHPDDPLQVRVGMNAGEVVTEGDDVFGETVNAAARISGLAPGGKTFASAVVKGLVGTMPDVMFMDRGLHELKGFPDDWQLFEVIDDVARAPVLLDRTPFVGRVGELTQLREHLERALRGRGTLVMIGGEPGVGKTRLCEEIALDARRRGAVIFSGNCYEMEGAPPYSPFIEVLEATADTVPRDVLRDVLGDSAPEIARLLPHLRRLFPDIPEPVELPAEQDRRYTFNSIARYMRRAAAAAPLVLVLEDLHWADDATLLLLEHLAANLSDIPVLILGTYRDVELAVSRPLARTLGGLLRQSAAHRMSLRRLDEQEVKAMLHRLSGTPPPDAFVAAVYAETEGNAFFVEEVFRHLLEEGRVLDDTGAWRSDTRLEETDVPESIRLVIGRRLERLGDDTRRALVAAAVIGRIFDYEVLASVGGMGDDLLDALEEAERARLIVGVPQSRRVRYTFVHELVRQTLLGDISLPRRQRLHLAVAEAFERAAADVEVHAADLAHHLFQAGAAADPAKTVRYLVAAGDRAMEAAAAEDALRSYDNALSILEHGDPTRGPILFKRGRAQRALRRRKEAMQSWHDALSIFQSHHDARYIARTVRAIADQHQWLGEWKPSIEILQRGLESLRSDDERAGLLAPQAVGYAWAGEHAAAERSLQEDMRLTDSTGDARVWLGGQVAAMIYHYCFARSDQATSIGRALAEILRGGTSDWLLASVLSFLQGALVLSGRWQEAEDVYQEVWTLGSRLGHPGARLQTARWHGTVTFLKRADADRALREVEADLVLATEEEMLWAAEPHSWRGTLDYFRGSWDGALEEMITGDRLANVGALNGVHHGALLLHRAYLGQKNEAVAMFEGCQGRLPTPGVPNTIGSWTLLQLAVEALAVAGAWQEVAGAHSLVLESMDGGNAWRFWNCIPIHGLAALTAAATGFPQEAEEHFTKALELASEVDAVFTPAEVKRLYGLALLEFGGDDERSRVIDLMDDAERIYDACGMPRHVEMARDLRARARAVPKPAAQTADFRKEGEFWTIGFQDGPVRLKDSVGLRCLAQLLENPGTEIHAADLMGFADGRGPTVHDVGDAGEVLDERAHAAYRDRITALREELAEAEEWNDPERAAKARAEIETLTDHLAEAAGLGGRVRKAASTSERARVNATKAIKGALKKIADGDPALGAHLAASVRTGTFCAYEPDPGGPEWRL